MEKKIEDYLHLYLGCDVEVKGTRGRLESIGCRDMGEDCVVCVQNQDEDSVFYGEYESQVSEHHRIKPILRPLSSMTDEEALKVAEILGGAGHFSEESRIDQVKSALSNLYKTAYNVRTIEWFRLSHYLLSKHFDIFELIEAGLAIDSTTIKP